MAVELGLDTFGDTPLNPEGAQKRPDQVLRDVVEQAVVADKAGVDFIGLGEHHRPDFAISAPEIVLAAIAGRTERIRLGTAVTVLSSDDPVRVFQRFSTLNAVSNGRAEVILGRGSFTESYPLFGYDMSEYEVLFEEKLDLFAQLVREKEVTWAGSTRTGLNKVRVQPPLGPEGMPVWVGVGGSPESVVRVVRQDLQLMLAIIGGDPRRFLPYIDLYHRACAQLEKPVRPVGVHSPGFVAATDEEAREIAWPAHQEMYGRLGRERGWPPTTKARFIDEIENGSLYIGSPETVARKIAATVADLGLARFDMKYATGPIDHGALVTCVGLYGEKVIPMVRDILAATPAS